MAKKTKKMLIESADVLKLKRLAGLSRDDSDLDEYNYLIKETSEIPGSPVSAPEGSVATKSGEETPVLQEKDEELEDEMDDEDDGDSEFGGMDDDEEFSDDEFDGMDSESDMGGHEEPDGDEGLGMGAGGGSDKMAIANALKTIGQALGITVEVEGEGSDTGAPIPGDEMGTEPPAGEEMTPTETPIEGESMGTGAPAPGDQFGDEDPELSRDQQKMLAEIFSRASKKIMESLKNAKKANSTKK